MKKKIKRIIVTGGCGFIGSHLVDRLLEKKYVVLNIDSLTYASVKKNFKDKNYSFLKSEIQNKKIFNKIKKFDPDIIINCAAESHVDRSINNPSKFLESNIFGTFNLLEIIRKVNKKIIFYQISTDEVFGSLKLSENKFSENSNYCPQSPYSASKASADHFVRSYANTYKLNYLISNCSNNYGTRQNYEKFIPTIILSCIKKEKIPIYGKGNNIRDWISVHDHVNGIIKIFESRRLNKTYLIGSNNEMSNLVLVKTICKYFNKHYKNFNYNNLIKFVTDRKGHDFRYAINSRKILKELRWKPIHDLNSELPKLIEYYKKYK